MRAEKRKEIVHVQRITLPSKDALEKLARRFGISKNTVQGYLNVSGNRHAAKAIDVQVSAINEFGGRLVTNTSFEESLVVYDEAEQIIYEVK